jgi:hypothetical protein
MEQLFSFRLFSPPCILFRDPQDIGSKRFTTEGTEENFTAEVAENAEEDERDVAIAARECLYR